MTVSDEFLQLLFVKVMQHGTTSFNPLAVTSTALGGFNERGFGVNRKWLLNFRHRASSIYDRRFATLQRTLFYIFNQQIYLII